MLIRKLQRRECSRIFWRKIALILATDWCLWERTDVEEMDLQDGECRELVD